jgi:hypothetical protein
VTARPTLVVFLGGLGGSPIEEMVCAAKTAATLDSLEAALASGAFAGAIVATDIPSLHVDVRSVATDIDQGPFRFGSRLADLIRRNRLESVVYLGGGSVPLFKEDDFAALACGLERRETGITNNVFSSDLVAFPVGEATLAAIESLERDNALARALTEGAGLTHQELPRTLATQMDIDAPTDLAVLSLARLGGRRLQEYLATLDIDVSRYRRVLPLFLDTKAQIVVAGRVGSHAWQYLERETACRVRMLAEERGLEAEGRAQDGTARSLLGFYLQSAGIERFFTALAELGDAAFIDTRVLLAHLRIDPGREDRFLSDLGHWQEVGDSFLREFTQAATAASIPVLLGGHSLMSGGLMALNEFAWAEKEAADSD